MTSSRLVLVFLGIIFLIIIILSSNRIGQFARERFGKFLPNVKMPYQQISPTPTIKTVISPTPVKISSLGTSSNQQQGYQTDNSISNNLNNSATKGGNPPATEIPATGPNEIVTLLLAGSGILGFYINKKTG